MDSLIIICSLVYLVMMGTVNGNVVLMGRNLSKSFDDMEANFTPKVKDSGESGVLYLADPIDACSPLINNVLRGSKPAFVLIISGRCSFDDKVKSAQNAGFRAAIVYDCKDGTPLILMGGTPEGIKIHAVFVSKASGSVLEKYAGLTDNELWILPTIEGSTWSIMAVSFIFLLTMSSMLGTCIFVCKHRIRIERPRAPQIQEFSGMSCLKVKAMPSLRFTTVLEDNCTSITCAICLEDYHRGEQLRILPCCHKFHAACVDSWLTAWRTFCPVCKGDANTGISTPPPSESTPLLSSNASSPLSTTSLLPFNSSVALSPSIPFSRTYSLSSSYRMANSYKSYNNSPSISITRSSADFRNVPSQRSPYSSRYIVPYRSSSSNASPSYFAGSSSRHSYLWHCESGANISALASGQSLPSF